MLRLIIKSVGWVIHHLALFVGILCTLIFLQTLGSIYENWAQISSAANPENPIEDLSKVLAGKSLTNEYSDICKERETAIVAHKFLPLFRVLIKQSGTVMQAFIRYKNAI